MTASTQTDSRTAQPFFADRQAAQQALQLVMPMIEAAMGNREVGESGFLYIVVMNPVLCPWEADFEDAILLEHAVGDRERWDADYAAYARAKARSTWLAGRDTHGLSAVSPHLLRVGDAGVWGSAVVDGIVVATSGVNAWYDEAFSGAIAYALRAVAKGRAAAHAPCLRLE
ncbi:hypothetical protein [Bordetella flabilis]|uniref:Uncharacterized protein n=1 Tax=Bordetella flabilis TaxID=463014 RepID=A0A193G854_9BORD|nr:hypothetical protein [Bordetella flabilis]ANN76167.1 hypothetical protein BAU07_02670 [Bordetella flabilis]